jgi:Xaa-Pro aminopeptidase
MQTVPALSVYQRRRRALLNHMRAQGGGVAIIPTAPELLRNRDTGFPYRHDSYFYYLTGFAEPESVLVLVAGKKNHAVLFCRPKHLEREIWDGFRYGPKAAQQVFGLDEAVSIEHFDTRLPDLIANQPALFYSLGYSDTEDARVLCAMNAVRAQTRAGKVAPLAIHDVRTVLDNMRLIKDAHEVGIMKRAAGISAAAHARAMRFTRPGVWEYEVEAELLHAFRSGGSECPAYTSIVATGANACVLHYVSNNAQTQDGDLMLIDAGCELQGYASDITRTFPVNGKFSAPQKDLYEVVLAAQAAAQAKTRPGVRYNEPHEAAVRVLAQGMLDYKLLQGSLDEVIDKGNRDQGGYRQFYMHRTGHWLGMDVHDAGDYKTGDTWNKLQPGNVVTIEPGLYVRPAKNVPKAFWNIGIRIEDDALVTAKGCELITAAAPKTIQEIEACMAR